MMKKALIWISILILVFLGAYFSLPRVLEGMASYLIVRDEIEPAAAIVVLGGDDNGERVNEAVQLYWNGYADKLLMSGGPLAWKLTSAEWMKRQALIMGVPARAVILEDRSESTLENALYSLAILKRLGVRSVILVTSPNHSRRAKNVFQKVFSKENIKVMSYPAQKSDFRLSGWWTRHEDTQLVVWEYVSLVYYFLKRI